MSQTVDSRPAADASPSAAPTAAVPRAGRTVLLAVVAGALLAVVWSYEFVDDVVAGAVMRGILGADGEEVALGSAAAGAVFALVSGFAGTFTACNIAAFGAVAPMLGRPAPLGRRLLAALRPLGYVAAGAVTVSACYGFVGVLLADHLPQLSAGTVGDGMPARLLQSIVVYVVLGAAMLWLGLAAVGYLPDPLRRAEHRWPHARLVALGAIVGALLVGRPFPLFHRMFQYAAETGNPLYGSLTFVLQSVGNMVVMATLFVALALAFRGRFPRWLAASPHRAARAAGAALLVAGAFTVLYWGVRVPAIFGYGWFPQPPWNG